VWCVALPSTPLGLCDGAELIAQSARHSQICEAAAGVVLIAIFLGGRRLASRFESWHGLTFLAACDFASLKKIRAAELCQLAQGKVDVDLIARSAYVNTLGPQSHQKLPEEGAGPRRV